MNQSELRDFIDRVSLARLDLDSLDTRLVQEGIRDGGILKNAIDILDEITAIYFADNIYRKFESLGNFIKDEEEDL